MPDLNELNAISAIDGRYWKDLNAISEDFSDYALIRGRVTIEIEYLIALSEYGVTDSFSYGQKRALRDVYRKFTLDDARRVNALEKETDHDVKAIEYFLKEKGVLPDDRREEVHLGLTSEDPTNIAYSIAWKKATNGIYSPVLNMVQGKLILLSDENKDVPMLGRTHGKAAEPTTVGKEFGNYAYRLNDGMKSISKIKMLGKLNGAVGNYNDLAEAYPNVDWIDFTSKFVKKFGLEPCFMTTQLLPHDRISKLMREIVGINEIMIDLDQDMWRYISDDWLLQKTKKGTTGSSVMPQKINPRFFENSEGNLEYANWIFTGMASKLQKSRLQRDLSDSTVKRNYGVPLAHTILGYKMALTNLNRLYLGVDELSSALEKHPEIISGAIQTILRREGVEGAYELMRDYVRGKDVTLEDLHAFADELDVSDEVKAQIKAITPESLLGYSSRLTQMFLEEK